MQRAGLEGSVCVCVCVRACVCVCVCVCGKALKDQHLCEFEWVRAWVCVLKR